MINEKKFRDLYSDFLKSGLTIRAYCSNHQISEAKFFYWQHKLKYQLPPKGGFVPVVFDQYRKEGTATGKNPHEFLSNPPVPTDKAINCEISYPNGVSIKLNSCADIGLLRSLLLLIQQ
jgi:hypothetical protein